MGKGTKSGVGYHTLDLQSLSRQATERSPLPMAAMEGSTHIVRYVNPTFCRLVERESEELVGVPFARAVPEAGECLPHLDQAYHTGEAETGVVKVHFAPHPLHWSYAIWAVPDASNHPVGVMIHVTDTTKAELFRQNVTAMNQELLLASVRQHELTEAAKKLNAELQQAYDKLVEESRERERLNEQLRQAHKMEAIGVLAGGIAHDFNNMLAGIIGNAELALADIAEGSGARHNLEQIFRAGLRGRELVRQILTFGRRSESEQKVLLLGPLVRDTFDMLRASLPNIITMHLDLEAGTDAISADPSQIQQVLINLCTNAAYAMRETGGKLEISLRSVTLRSDDFLPETDMPPGDYLVISVRDTGCGMDEAVKERIFEPFFTTKPPEQGTGLGLSVVYGIVKSHKGSIMVLSEPRKGSVFRVFFPHAGPAGSLREEASEPVPRGKERILFVDDEAQLAETGRAVLERLGYSVVIHIDAIQALHHFAEHPDQCDLVITDQTMPKMTGLILAENLLHIRADIPIILCTGYSDLVSQETARVKGIREFFMKPFTRQEIAHVVRRVLDRTDAD